MYFPLLFKDDISCLIVGGGQVATRKMDILLPLRCRITVVAPQATEIIEQSFNSGRIRWTKREYDSGDCRGFQLVIAATPFRNVNRAVSDEARSFGIPVNVVDDPELSTVIFPAVWRDESLLVAVSTQGVAPFMAAEIRNRLTEYTLRMGRWVEIAGKFRDSVRKAVPNQAEREALYRKFLNAGQPDEDNPPPAGSNLDEWLEWIDRIRK